MKKGIHLTVLVVALMLSVRMLSAQNPGGRGGPPQTPRSGAPVDFIGYWVSVVTEDWRFRMVTPTKGDFQGVPMTPAAREIANAWDPARDAADGNQCKSYGAPAIMRVPGRLHMTWDNDQTMKLEADAGTQTRNFNFGKGDTNTARTIQGTSAAEWVIRRGASPGSGSLKVVTSRLLAGYLRKNGVPYSENAVLTEYFDIIRQPNGERWLVVTSVVDDPLYLQQPFTTSTHFKAQADASGWNPSPCSSTW